MEEIVIFGTGGHAKVVHDILIQQNKYKVCGFVSLEADRTEFMGLPHFNQANFADLKYTAGIVAIGDNSTRNRVVDFIKKLNSQFKFVSAVHPSASVASDVFIGSGTVVMAQAAINPGSRVGSFSIVNTGAVIDHDCFLGEFSSVAPGCVLGGNVSIGNFSAVSLGASIIHGKKIGEETVIGAGSVVLDDVGGYQVAFGSPCRVVRSRAHGDKYL